ncbi:MAG: LacI family DNA-binding transcriptional regulator [Gammaproteobacteria bacterium]|jgi:LacI family transcriptional regulator|nr:LacI family DNA-binding transcriptional regulator [Gammaproteobacteria bacterium]
MSKASILEVSKLAGVSPATVSRVTSNAAPVRETTRKKVLAAMEELGYQPNSAAQSLSSKRSNTLGMIVSHVDGPFYGPVMSGVEATLRKLNKHVIIASGFGEEQAEKEAVDFLMARQVDGLILLTEGLDSEYLKDLEKRIPIYLINQHVDGLENRNMYLDNDDGAYKATRHLIDQGHKDIVYIAGQIYKQDANERVVGFKRAMQEAGLIVTDKHIVHTSFEVEGGVIGMQQIAESGVPYTAVLAGNDEAAFGVYEWAARNGFSIPDDFSVIGFDDILMANYVSPRLSTMHFPKYDMAKACATMAYQEIYGKKAPEGIKFKTDLVVRDSVTKQH